MKTNFDQYKEEILTVLKDYDSFALTRTGNKIVPCSTIPCFHCKFSVEGIPCSFLKAQFLYQKVEPEKNKITITKNEKAYLNLLSSEAKYMARDKRGTLCVYNSCPQKDECDFNFWMVEDDTAFLTIEYDPWFKDIEFSFIKWEDDEPWSIEDLLALEVIE